MVKKKQVTNNPIWVLGPDFTPIGPINDYTILEQPFECSGATLAGGDWHGTIYDCGEHGKFGSEKVFGNLQNLVWTAANDARRVAEAEQRRARIDFEDGYRRGYEAGRRFLEDD